MNPRTRTHRNIFKGLCMALAFFIPFSVRLLPFIILLMVVNWLTAPFLASRLKAAFKERDRLLTFSFILLYLFYLVGMLYSKDVAYGWFDLEIKLSLLIFPLIFASSGESRYDHIDFDRILYMFIAGALAGAFLFFGHSAYLSYTTLIIHPFYYGNLSWYMHPSYLSMYSCFAIAVLAYLAIQKSQVLPVIIKALMPGAALILASFIILLSARSGILMLIILGLCLSIFVIFLLKRPWAGIGFLAGFGALMLVFAMLFPFAMGRFASAKQSVEGMENRVPGQKTEAAATRLLVWKSALELILVHPFTGVGTGDVKDEMVKNYRKNGMHQAYDEKLNSHDQYLQTAVALGIPGLLALLLSLVIPAVFTLRKGLYLYFTFLLIVAFNFIFESMLETQAGTIFYGFFNTVLFWYGMVLNTKK